MMQEDMSGRVLSPFQAQMLHTEDAAVAAHGLMSQPETTERQG